MKNKGILFGLLISVSLCRAGFSQSELDFQQSDSGASDFRTIAIQSHVTNVQPMTGIVMWQDSDNRHSDAIQLEFSYLRYSDVVKKKGKYDWSPVEGKLDDIAGRKHQAVLRFWDTYPGQESGVPDYIKLLSDYQNITAKSEKRDTGFPDWSHPEYQRFVLEFYKEFAARYDKDPRLAFLESGFGLWSEYHVYSGPEEPGVTFPSKEFQSKFIRHLSNVFQETPWLISKDAQAQERTPFASEPGLLDLRFGIFDDTFHLAWKRGYNLDGWTFFGRNRYQHSPAGGEILFPNQKRAKHVATNWKTKTRDFGITFMICDQWPRWSTLERIKEHSLACGYKFNVLAFEANINESRVTVKNDGVAPIYYDAFVAVNGVRAASSLRHLQPGEIKTFAVASGGEKPKLTIECDRLVAGQRITFAAGQE